MPHCYFLFPCRDGRVPNPFPLDDPLFRMSQFAIRVLKGPAEHGERTACLGTEPSGSDQASTEETNHDELYKQWRQRAYWVSLEACSIAFVELINRVLVSRPPSENHWDFAAFEAAHRALKVVFYIHYEATRHRPFFSWKKEMESLLTDWLDIAKDVWRSRVLDPECGDLME